MTPPIETAIEVRFPLALFDAEVVKRAVFRISASCSAEFSLDDGDIVCRLMPPEEITPKQRSSLEHRLRTEVLDQDLRARINRETEGVRNVVFAFAFSRTGLDSEQVQES